MIVIKIDIMIFTLNDDCSIIRVNMIIMWNDALTNNTSEIVTKVFVNKRSISSWFANQKARNKCTNLRPSDSSMENFMECFEMRFRIIKNSVAP